MRTHGAESIGGRRRASVLGASDAARRAARAVVGLAVLGAAASACAGEDEREVLPPVVLGMLETTAPTYDDGQEQIYQVGREVRLPYRRPRDEERPSGAQDPYPRRPFHVTGDSRVTIRYTLSNLEDRQHTVELLIDPWNEFVRYVPGVALGEEDETQPNLSGIDRFFVVPAKSRIEGILTPDDMKELATDLGTAMSLAATPPAADSDFGGPVLYNRAFNVQNRSSEPDPVLAPYLPSVAAGITGFDLGLRTYDGAAKVAVELMIDVEDVNGERVLMPDDDGTPIGPPGATLTPPGGLGGM